MTVESGCMCACHMLNIISHHNDCLCFILVAILLHNQHVTHDAVLTYTQRDHATDLEPCTSHTTLIPTWLATLDMMAKGSHVGPEILMGLALRWNFFSMYSQFMFDFTNGCFTGLQELSDLHDVSWSLVVQSNEKKKPLQIDSFKWCYDISEIVDPIVHVKVGHCFTVGVVMVLT